MIPACSGGLLAAEVVKAVREGDLDAVRSWLAAGGDEFVDEPAQYEYRRPLDPDVYYATEKLIHHAISGDSANSTAMVEVLLQAGARPELDFLMAAIGRSNVNAALTLLAHGVDPTPRFGVWTAIHYAANEQLPNQAGLIRALLDAGASANARTSGNHVTPLMFAAGNGFTCPRVLRLLLKYGADVDAVAGDGRTVDDFARRVLEAPLWPHPDRSPRDTREWRAPGVAEGALALFRDFRDFRAAGGTWKRFEREPREELLILRRLVGRFRAAPPSVLFRLFRPQFPDVLFWKVLGFWRSERDA